MFSLNNTYSITRLITCISYLYIISIYNSIFYFLYHEIYELSKRFVVFYVFYVFKYSVLMIEPYSLKLIKNPHGYLMTILLTIQECKTYLYKYNIQLRFKFFQSLIGHIGHAVYCKCVLKHLLSSTTCKQQNE